jgi:hypothetical protein
MTTNPLAISALTTLLLLSVPANAGNALLPQVTADSVPLGSSSMPQTTSGSDSQEQDYQSQILSDPTISGPGRVNAMTGGDGVNTAIIVQHGDANSSNVIQNGSNNFARQKQTGTMNELKLEQNGKHNRSEEEQNGDYNHKIILQNGKASESLIIQQAAPTDNTKEP